MNDIFAPQIPRVPITGTDSLFPVHRIFCVGRNYVDHAIEMGHSGREDPFFFLKPSHCIALAQANSQAILNWPYPSLSSDVHHEIELVVAIGQSGQNIQPENAHEHIFGYAVGLDMTRRDLQAEMKKQGRPWSIGKAFDASAPISAITPKEQVQDIEQAVIQLFVNQQLQQSSNISHLIWNVPEIIAHLSKAWKLQAGDLIYTGTPAGVGKVQVGDRLIGEIKGLSSLELKVVAP